MRDIEQKLVKAVKGWGSAAEIKTAEECICKIIPHELRGSLLMRQRSEEA